MTRKEAWKIIKEIETAMVGDKKLDMAAMGTDQTDTDYRSYLWYRPKNDIELESINIYYRLNFVKEKIGRWIGVETHLCPDEYDDDDYDDDYEALDIKYAMQNTITFWEALGYKIIIEEDK